jgi:ribosomal protein S18 acetylase RimI-like enzyme
VRTINWSHSHQRDSPNTTSAALVRELPIDAVTTFNHPLDNPVWHALRGPHSRFAVQHGLALHYQRDVAAFSAFDRSSAQAYSDLAHDLPAGAEARLVRREVDPLPAGWVEVNHVPLLQMLATQADVDVIEGPAFISLGAAHAGAAAALVHLTRPGPFGARTLEMGRYIGVFESGECGQLLALAGERMHLPGYIELSAICTHPHARGRRLAEYLMRHLMHAALARGERPFLHVLPDNHAAIALYRRLGFEVRAQIQYLWRKPETALR